MAKRVDRRKVDVRNSPYGLSEDALRQASTVYRSDLFKDKVVVVTGAGSGLGRATAALFARFGANVAICGRDEQKLDDAQSFLEGLGATVFSKSLTIRNPEQVSDFIDGVWREWGGIDVLVNNAGGQFPQPAIDFSVRGWNAVIDTNLNGTWYMMQAAAKKWRETGSSGNIINVVAVVARGLPDMAHTCAARAGVIHLSRTVAVEWAPLGIRVNCVAPGCVETSAFGYYPPEGAKTFAQSNPMMKVGDELDVAQAIVYLAAESGKFITGETIHVDGGQQNWGDPWPAGRPPHFELSG